MIRAIFVLSIALATIAGPALAHPGAGAAAGLPAGFAHPFAGLDHVLAMVAVGILAVQAGGRSLLALPAAFVGMMVAGGALALAGMALPFVEPGIVGSVVVLGAVVALGRRLPAGAALGLVAVFAVFHGQAHAVEMPAGAGIAGYAFGFAVATATLHAAGIGLAAAARRAGGRLAPVALRMAGGTIALAGAALAAV